MSLFAEVPLSEAGVVILRGLKGALEVLAVDGELHNRGGPSAR